MPHSKPHSDITGRILGLLTFLGGIALLVIVFTAALQLFHTPLPTTHEAGASPTAMGLGTAFAEFLEKLLLLGLLTIVGSVCTSRGIEMYFSANGWTDASAHPRETAPAKPQKPAATDSPAAE